LEKKDIMTIRDHGVFFRTDELVSMLRDEDAFMLLAFLRPSKVMVNVHGRQCLDKLLGWHRICLPAARRRLIEMGYTTAVGQAGKRHPAVQMDRDR
jgi:hypothetical protein